MKGELIPRIDLISEVVPLTLFLERVPSSSTYNVTTRVAQGVSVEDENTCKVAWVVHMSIIRITGLAISEPSWDFRSAGSDLKIT